MLLLLSPSSYIGMAIIIQLFIYSFGGQLIKDRSSRVAENFYDFDADYVIIIAKAQKSSKIETAFFQANLETFSNIMKSTASLITLLQSFLE
jgi:7tm Odorant receptor